MSEQWQQAKEIFDAALRRKPDGRKAYLDEACRDDDFLRGEVESLLSSFDDAESFLEKPAVGEVADVMLEENNHLTKGKTFSHYKILSQIGAGGMGEVFLAEDTLLKRQVAIKFLNHVSDKNSDHLSRFFQEARAASALNHPNILTIHEIGDFEDTNYIAAEFVKGKTLREHFKHDEISLNEILDIVIQLANALSAAHSAGIVHRDIKPENIMLREDGLVKVLDFGLAKLTQEKTKETDKEASTRPQVNTQAGMILGTVAYMSPEQARGRAVDARTDVWSLGVVLYEMLTGKQPFRGETSSDVIASILKTQPAPPTKFNAEIPAELNRIVLKTLQKDRDERYQVVKDLLIDLKHLKKHLEFEAEFGVPSLDGEKPAKAGTQNDETKIIINPTTDESHAVSSAEYLVSEIKQHKRGFAAALIILLVAAIGFGYWFFANRSASQTPIQSIAVMPFVNQSGNTDIEYLADGITETLISNLSQLQKLDVRASSSVFRFKGKDVSLRQIGKELNVQAVLTGRVVQRGDDLTFYIELVDAATEKVLWRSDYNRQMTNLISLQSEIARDVSRKLETRLSGADEQKLAKNYTTNPEAYQLYLKGRFHWNKRTQKDSQKAIEYFQQVIALDPNYALAFAGLAGAYALNVNDIGGAPSSEVMPKAKEAALKALSLDDNLAEAHTALGIVLMGYDYDFAGAEAKYKRALELNPNYVPAHQFYSVLLLILGRTDEGIAEMQRALEIEPLSIWVNRAYGVRLSTARKYDEAISQLKKTLEMDENFVLAHTSLASVYQLTGNYAESVQEYSRARELIGKPQDAALIRESFIKGGWKGFLRIMTTKLRPTINSYPAAAYHLELGEEDKALAELEKAYANHEYGLIQLRADPRLDPLRDDPRFQDLLKRVGFPQ